jgi:hypothetical protein
MAYCTKCGSPLNDDAFYCPNCGQRVAGGPAGGGGGSGTPPPPGMPPPAPAGEAYPARLEIDYPDRQLNRASTFFRLFAAIPILIVVGSIEGGSFTSYNNPHGSTGFHAAVGGGVLIAPVVLMLLFRRKYPGWWFDWNLQLSRFTTRVGTYLALLDDRYPSTDEEQSVHLEFDPPDGAVLSRWLPLVKWLLAVPHYIVLVFLALAAFFVVVFAWFAILFTGRYPRGAFRFVVGVFRWGLRVEAYAFLLITDRYPPFSLDP